MPTKQQDIFHNTSSYTVHVTKTGLDKSIAQVPWTSRFRVWVFIFYFFAQQLDKEKNNPNPY